MRFHWGLVIVPFKRSHLSLCLAFAFLPSQITVLAGGVTLITHGFNGNVTDWVIPMADKIPAYRTFPGTNVSEYQISITRSGSTYSLTQTFLDGVLPAASDSGEILIALDWSTLSADATVSTAAIAAQAAAALLATNLIPDLNGHALAELPLHFVGHSRGGSVITETARFLGAQGVWVDHVTTLDPHPVSQLGDPSMKNYSNILFADNYWQNLGDNFLVPNGESIPGAYNRQLTGITNGGYASSHSDVHLWYHGTIDLLTPATDTQATITAAERPTWWTPFESAGTNTGFLFSLLGGGDRFSNAEPGGAGKGRISDGLNKVWDLGAGIGANRVSLPANNGAWPNLLRFNVTGTNRFAIGEPIPLALYHQHVSNTSTTATVRFYLDADPNPFNGNATLVTQTNLAGTGTNSVSLSTFTISPNPATTVPGACYLYASISDGSRTRLLYAPQKLILTPTRQPPLLSAQRLEAGLFRCTVSGTPGQTIVVQASTNLSDWLPLQTNLLSGTTWDFVDNESSTLGRRFYRALLQ